MYTKLEATWLSSVTTKQQQRKPMWASVLWRWYYCLVVFNLYGAGNEGVLAGKCYTCKIGRTIMESKSAMFGYLHCQVLFMDSLLTWCNAVRSFYSHLIFGFLICWGKKNKKKNKRQASWESFYEELQQWLEPERDVPFSWMTLHMWFGLSVKCLLIRSPPDASTRRSHLRQTKVNLRGKTLLLSSIQTKPTPLNEHNINADGCLL